MNKDKEYDIAEIIANIVVIILFILFIIMFIIIPNYLKYKYDVYTSPCSEVYNENILIYKGNSYFYKTESRGNSTIFKEYEKKFLFPKMKKEIMSNKLEIKTCEE